MNITLRQAFLNIADAIRRKKTYFNLIAPINMAEEIRNIDVGFNANAYYEDSVILNNNAHGSLYSSLQSASFAFVTNQEYYFFAYPQRINYSPYSYTGANFLFSVTPSSSNVELVRQDILPNYNIPHNNTNPNIQSIWADENNKIIYFIYKYPMATVNTWTYLYCNYEILTDTFNILLKETASANSEPEWYYLLTDIYKDRTSQRSSAHQDNILIYNNFIYFICYNYIEGKTDIKIINKENLTLIQTISIPLWLHDISTIIFNNKIYIFGFIADQINNKLVSKSYCVDSNNILNENLETIPNIGYNQSLFISQNEIHSYQLSTLSRDFKFYQDYDSPDEAIRDFGLSGIYPFHFRTKNGSWIIDNNIPFIKEIDFPDISPYEYYYLGVLENRIRAVSNYIFYPIMWYRTTSSLADYYFTIARSKFVTPEENTP